jgi:xylan 1,4-beta-xylosidase
MPLINHSPLNGIIIAMKKIFVLVLLLHSTLLQAQSFSNPILAGFYPDPSICRAGSDYYIVNSSFSYYPGLPLFHSKDLLNWKQIGYAMDRPSQLNLDGAGVSRGLFAPSISYHNGTFYIVCTLIDKLGNFVITAKDPTGPWSDPVALPEVNGIDPSLFFDDNGQSYILFNSIPPNNISLHDGHRTIRMFAFDAVNMKVVGEEKLLINGGTDMAKKPVWIEGPHLIKKDGWYYLLCAEGGTGYNHSAVIFRSKSVDGPFESYKNNPILTQRQLDPQRSNPITTTGHADFVQAADGTWWAVFLGCRPYEGDYYNTGRETFMAPVEWKDGWPTISLGGAEVKYSYPIDAIREKRTNVFSGNYFFKDDFNSPVLNSRYSFLRTKREDWYSLTQPGGKLSMQLRPPTCSGTENPSFIGFRQAHIKGYAATELVFGAQAAHEKAGLMIFQNEYHYYFLCQSVQEGKPVVQLFRGPGNQNKTAAPELLAAEVLNGKEAKGLRLKIEAVGKQYNFYYAGRFKKWKLLQSGLDAKFLSTKNAGGFVGCMYAMYATSNGKPTNNQAIFNWFEAKNMDDVYSH